MSANIHHTQKVLPNTDHDQGSANAYVDPTTTDTLQLLSSHLAPVVRVSADDPVRVPTHHPHQGVGLLERQRVSHKDYSAALQALVVGSTGKGQKDGKKAAGELKTFRGSVPLHLSSIHVACTKISQSAPQDA